MWTSLNKAKNLGKGGCVQHHLIGGKNENGDLLIVLACWMYVNIKKDVIEKKLPKTFLNEYLFCPSDYLY